MSGQNRLEHKQKSTTVKQDRVWILLLGALIALGIAISLAPTYHGSEPIELIGP
jgi:hypothetical protein